MPPWHCEQLIDDGGRIRDVASRIGAMSDRGRRGTCRRRKSRARGRPSVRTERLRHRATVIPGNTAQRADVRLARQHRRVAAGHRPAAARDDRGRRIVDPTVASGGRLPAVERDEVGVVDLLRPIAAQEPRGEVDADLGDRHRARDDERRDDVLAPVVRGCSRLSCEPVSDDRLAQTREQEAQRRGGVDQRVGAVEHHGAIEIRGSARMPARCGPSRGAPMSALSSSGSSRSR